MRKERLVDLGRKLSFNPQPKKEPQPIVGGGGETAAAAAELLNSASEVIRLLLSEVRQLKGIQDPTPPAKVWTSLLNADLS